MKAVIVDGRISVACERGLLSHGFYPIKLPPKSGINTAVSSHPDCLIFKYGDELITPLEYYEDAALVFAEIRELFPHIKITLSDDTIKSDYPHDAPMNALVMGNRLFCKTDTVSDKILRLGTSQRLSLHHTRQGYPACTTLALNDNAAITADPGMAKKLTECNVKVTLIRQGGVLLPPHEYGFIGGASGVYDGMVYFFGDYTRHPDSDKIHSAAQEAGLIPISLSDEPLFDLGGIIFID